MQLTNSMISWLANGDRGVSSNTIFSHLTGVNALVFGGCHPLDPDDLWRCRELLKRCPELKAELPRMATKSKEWAALVPEWDNLCAMMDEEAPNWPKFGSSAKRTYLRMQELFEQASMNSHTAMEVV